jgi:hypothetical protein
MKNIMRSFFIVSGLIMYLFLGVLVAEKAYKKRAVENPKESWKVHLYSGGKEITTYTTVGCIRQISSRSTISFTDVLSGKEVVISGTFVAEEF